MSDSEPPSRIDTAYCTTACLVTVSMVITGVLRISEYSIPGVRTAGPVLAFSLVALYPVGILLQGLTLRLFRPKEVTICLVITAIWSGVMLCAMLFGRRS